MANVGGVFSSEHDYALIADGFSSIQDYDNNAHLIGEGKGLLVRGTSLFSGKIELANNDPQQQPANFVEMFEVDEEEYISPGDILVISDKRDRLLCRTHRPYNRAVAGIVAGNPVIKLRPRTSMVNSSSRG